MTDMTMNIIVLCGVTKSNYGDYCGGVQC